ncbi:MAG: hypothetical protein P8Y18_07910 [Candidatus Bathyarchaeota archaeon]
MSSGIVFTVGSDIVNSWLIYGILAAITNLSNLDPLIILKIFAPILSATTCVSVYFVALKKLNWNPTKSLLASLIFCFLSILALFTVWGHELAMLSLLFIIFITLITSAFKKQKIPFKLLMAILPAILLLMGNFFWISPFAAPTNSNIVRVDDSLWAHPQGLFFITDYLNVQTPIETYPSYFNLLSNVTALFLILYGLTLPLVFIGHFKDQVLNIWTALLLMGSFSCLIVPSFAIFLWARWMLLLVFPFSFFAANGLWKITKSLPGNKILKYAKKFKPTKYVCLTLFLASIILSCLFMIYPESDNNQGLINWGGSKKYVPSTMQTSSIPLQDISATQQAFNWLNSNMDNNSALLVHDAFDNWALLYLNSAHQGYLFDFNLQQATNYAKNQGYTNLYFIWWNQNITQYNIELSEQWTPIQNYERISIYQLT